MLKISLCLIFFAQIFDSNSLIVPDEVPSLLSVIYSNIPTFKKGTDSRLGWGFRLGNRADFQVLVELGPQQYTQKLGNQDDSGNSKRDIIDSPINTLYAKRQHEKKICNTEGGKFIDNWSKNVQKEQETRQQTEIETREGEIDAKSVIPDDVILKLEELYKKQKQLPKI